MMSPRNFSRDYPRASAWLTLMGVIVAVLATAQALELIR